MKKSIMRPNHFVLLAGLSLSALTFTACEREDVLPGTSPVVEKPTTTPPPATTPPATNTPLPPVALGSLVKQFEDVYYKYDAQNRLVEVGNTSPSMHGYTVEYEGTKPVKLRFINGDYLLYTYEGSKVTEAIRYSREGKVNFHYKFEYSGDRLSRMSTITYLDWKQGHLSIIDYKYDANGNMTEQVIIWSPSNSPDDMRGPGVVKWGNYDDKPNPMPFVDVFIYLPGVKLASNNPGFRDPGINKQLFTYTYHASGMPKERTQKLEPHPELPPHTLAYTY